MTPFLVSSTLPRNQYHYFSKHWGTDAWALPHLKSFWGPSLSHAWRHCTVHCALFKTYKL